MDRTEIERKDFERSVTINQAVERADHIIMQGADGDREEIILLTAEVCKAFADKIIFMVKVDAERKRIAADYNEIMGERVMTAAQSQDWVPARADETEPSGV